MFQIALVSDKHDDDVGISVVPQFLQPPCDVDICSMFRDVVYEQCADCAAVVSI